MAAVNQRIKNFLGGVSQQPDFIKFPGQLRVCDNAVPDVTFGLSKRSPGEFVADLQNATAGGQWITILRDNDEKYIAQISSNDIRVWNLLTGAEESVSLGPGASYSYLTSATDPYGVMSIGDYTLITNPQKTVQTARSTPRFLSPGPNPVAIDHYAFVNVKNVAYNSEYVIGINGSTLTPTTKRRARGLKVTVDTPQTGVADPIDGSWVDQTSNIQGPPKYAGKQEFYNATTGVKATVVVNGTPYVHNYSSNHEPLYHVRYNAEVVLQDGGYDVQLSGTTFSVAVQGINYTVTVVDSVAYETYADSGVAFYATPKDPNEGALSLSTILGTLKDQLISKYGVFAEVVGDGIFISDANSFTIEVRGGVAKDSMEVFQDSAQNISKLPSICKNNYIAKVSNTEESLSDDYYVKFVVDRTDTSLGSGVWEETVAPNITAGFDYDTMPHALVNNRNGTWTFRRLDTNDPLGNYWIDRQVGDDTTNPMPTFVGNQIKDIFFYRNRLGFVSGENVILSQASDYFNFFTNSAITASDADPIDIATSDVKPAILNHVLPIQKGLVMFSEGAQFMLFTEADVLSTETVQLKKLSSYECSPTVRPIDLGTSIMFSTGSTAFSRVFEMVIQDETIPPSVVEQTRVIPELLPNDIDHVSNSAQTGLVSYAKKDTSKLYFYKYYGSGGERQQSAWYTWSLTGNYVHSLFTAGNQYIVTEQDGQYILNRHEMVVDTTNTRSYQVGTGETSRRFEASLDNMTIASATYNSTTKISTVTLPYTYDNTYDMVAVFLSGTDAGVVRVPDSVSGTTATFNNIDLTTGNVAIGYKYITEIEFPNFYYAIDRGKYDIDGELRINRINFELGISGPMEFHLVSPQVDDYIQYESGIEVDLGSFNTTPTAPYKSVKVPIYRKNEKYTLTVKIPDPFTATLVSASWDGRYDNKRHIRR